VRALFSAVVRASCMCHTRCTLALSLTHSLDAISPRSPTELDLLVETEEKPSTPSMPLTPTSPESTSVQGAAVESPLIASPEPTSFFSHHSTGVVPEPTPPSERAPSMSALNGIAARRQTSPYSSPPRMARMPRTTPPVTSPIRLRQEATLASLRTPGYLDAMAFGDLEPNAWLNSFKPSPHDEAVATLLTRTASYMSTVHTNVAPDFVGQRPPTPAMAPPHFFSDTH
jgi:hypothetical protein